MTTWSTYLPRVPDRASGGRRRRNCLRPNVFRISSARPMLALIRFYCSAISFTAGHHPARDGSTAGQIRSWSVTSRPSLNAYTAGRPKTSDRAPAFAVATHDRDDGPVGRCVPQRGRHASMNSEVNTRPSTQSCLTRGGFAPTRRPCGLHGGVLRGLTVDDRQGVLVRQSVEPLVQFVE